jgi:hypothetical protein
MAEEGECVDWGIGWQNDISLHKHRTFVQHVLGPGQMGSSKHSNFQQQGSKNCWALNHLML